MTGATTHRAAARRRVRASGLAAAFTVLFAAGVPTSEAQNAGNALFAYVAEPGSAYEWRVRGRYERDAAEIVELRLHSQTWRGTLWKHRLFLIVPERVATPRDGLLIVAGGRWSEQDEAAEPPGRPPDGADDFVAMADAMQTVVAVLGTVPFQPLFGRSEDELIAYTFDRYLSDPEPDWPLLLPMVESVVRGMDAVQAATAELFGMELERFTVVGGSKRGWTAWLTAAVDARVAAFSPLVFDALNMAAHFPHQSRAWGAPAPKIAPYTDLGLDDVLSSQRGEALRRIVDPYEYLPHLTAPKLVVNATNDEYFPLDSLNLYWEALEGPKYALYVANQPHSIDELELVVPSIAALHRAAAGGEPLPELAWEYERDEAGVTLCIVADPAPARVVYWRAESHDRDFRDARFRPTPLGSGGAARVVELERPETGYAAVYADLRFDHGAAPYYLSTAPAILTAAGADPVEPAPAGNGAACTAAAR